MLAYPIELTPDDNDTLLVTCPDLPEVTSFGEDEADALLRAVGAIEEALAARMSDREDIPAPSPANGRPLAVLPALIAAKVAVWQAMRAQGLRKAGLARRLGWHAPQVDRLLDLDHASTFAQIEAALAALGKRLVVELQDAA
jgi:antitoxin HicB